MLLPRYTKQFEKDVKKSQKRGKDLEKLKGAIKILLEKSSLPQRFKDHRLVGDYKGRRECHLEPDWLLIYKLEEMSVIFERTGSHSDLFD